MKMLQHVFVLLLLLLQAATAVGQPGSCAAQDDPSTCEQLDDGAGFFQMTGRVGRLPVDSIVKRAVVIEEDELEQSENYDATLLEEQKEEQKNLEEEGEMEEGTDVEDWSDFHDPIMLQEEQSEEEHEEAGEPVLQEEDPEDEEGEDDSKYLGKADPEDGSERFPSIEAAKNALLEKERAATIANAEEAFRQQLDMQLSKAVGTEGSVVVGLLEKVACPENYYLHDTFVHLDHMSATLACRHCHAECDGFCYGPSLAECVMSEDKGMMQKTTQRQDGAAATSLASSLEQSFKDMFKSLTEGSYDELVSNKSSIPIQTDIPGIKECLANATCTVTNTYLGEVLGDNRDNETTADMVFSTSLNSSKMDVVDYADLPKSTRTAIDKETAACGFLPGVFKAPVGPPIEDPLSPADEDFPSPPANKASSALSTSSALQEDSEEHVTGSHRAQYRAQTLSWYTRYRLKQTAKSGAQWQAKKRLNDYAKTEISNWLNSRKDGHCSAAMDHLVGATQTVYGCFQENYASLQSAVCEPPAQHRTIAENLATAVSISKTLKVLSFPLQYVPYVGPVAKVIQRVSKLFLSKAEPVSKNVNKLRTQPKGKLEDANCCPPFATSAAQCKTYPYWKYKCGGCDSGVMCEAQRACNSLKKMKEKIDQWKLKYYDPMIERLAEAVMNVDMVMGPTGSKGKIDLNPNTIFAQCGIPNCVDAENFAKGVKNQIDSLFHDKICPIQVPKLTMPDLNILNTVLGWLNKINIVFGPLGLLLNKLHCIYIPRVEFWTENKCGNVNLPCCSWSGRRRWIPTLSCGWCGHRVCVPVPRARYWSDRVCFSAMHIINILSGFVKTLFAPIIYIIDLAINTLLSPIINLINQLIDKFFAPLKLLDNLKWPNLPMMNIDLPKFPTPLNCDFMKQMIQAGR